MIGCVGDGRASVKTAVALKPDLVLVDVGMPLLNGLDAGRELKKQMPRVKIIFLTMNPDPEVASEALRIGASGYLLKNSQGEELIQAIRNAVSGISYVTPQITHALEESFIRDPKSLSRPKHLSERQREVLQMLAEGRSMKEIAYILQNFPQNGTLSQISHYGGARYHDEFRAGTVCDQTRANSLAAEQVTPQSKSNPVNSLPTVTLDSRQHSSERKECHLMSPLRGAKCMSKIRVLLADDHQTVLERICGLLAEDFDVVGAVRNGQDAIAEAERLDPDVLVIDISMPILNGLQAALQLRSAKVATKIVFLTVHTGEDFVKAALSTGASGYITKVDVATDLVPAIQEALAGRTFVSSSITT